MRAKLLMSLLLGALTLTAFGQPEDPQLRRELQGFYAQADRLLAAKRDVALLRLYHPGFVAVDKQGKRTTYAQLRGQFAAMRANVRDAKVKTVVKHVRRQGPDEAVAWAEMVFTGKTRRGGRWTAIKSTIRFAETLKRGAGGWKAFYSQELPTNEPWSFKTEG